jgi:sulfur transfer protein SufE
MSVLGAGETPQPLRPGPDKLQHIVDLFAGGPKDLRLQALLEYSRRVPPLPEHLAGHREAMEQVVDCQTPFFLATEVAPDHKVKLWFDVPAEAPTTRGFAGILASGLEGPRPRRSWPPPTASTTRWASPKSSPACACGGCRPSSSA